MSKLRSRKWAAFVHSSCFVSVIVVTTSLQPPNGAELTGSSGGVRRSVPFSPKSASISDPFRTDLVGLDLPRIPRRFAASTGRVADQIDRGCGETERRQQQRPHCMTLDTAERILEFLHILVRRYIQARLRRHRKAARLTAMPPAASITGFSVCVPANSRPKTEMIALGEMRLTSGVWWPARRRGGSVAPPQPRRRPHCSPPCRYPPPLVITPAASTLRMRLSKLSAMYRLPDPSTATPVGKFSRAAVPRRRPR